MNDKLLNFTMKGIWGESRWEIENVMVAVRENTAGCVARPMSYRQFSKTNYLLGTNVNQLELATVFFKFYIDDTNSIDFN